MKERTSNVLFGIAGALIFAIILITIIVIIIELVEKYIE